MLNVMLSLHIGVKEVAEGAPMVRCMNILSYPTKQHLKKQQLPLFSLLRTKREPVLIGDSHLAR